MVVEKTFNNWAEVGEWWSANPTASRISPKIEAKTIEEHNQKNHAIQFPCTMVFEIKE